MTTRTLILGWIALSSLACNHPSLGIPTADAQADHTDVGAPATDARAPELAEAASGGVDPPDVAAIGGPPDARAPSDASSSSVDAAAAPAAGAPWGSCQGSSGCSDGSTCIVPRGAPDGRGVCVLGCGSEDVSARGRPCSAGGIDPARPGICLTFLWRRDPAVAVLRPLQVCTVPCDPLIQNCPQGFVCDASDPAHFGCLPRGLAVPIAEGASCGGFPVGECAAGLSCAECGPGARWCCRRFCDRRSDQSCPAGRTCERPQWYGKDLSYVGACSP
jgi:hypothetical protein